MSDDEYTPTTDQVREWASDDGGLAEYHDPINGHRHADRARRAFDRWLAAHDAEIREAASQTIEDLNVKLVRTRVNRDKLAQALWNTESAVTIAENEMTRQHRDRYLAAHDAEALRARAAEYRKAAGA